MNESDDTEKFYYELQLSIAHSEITKYRPEPLSHQEIENILRSLFVTRTDYEQYVIRFGQKEEQDRKDAEAREAARLARQENDPAYWKRLYLGMVEQEKERQRQREMMQGMWIVVGIAFAVLLVLKFVFHW